MDKLVENWILIVLLISVICIAIDVVSKFIKLPSKEQEKKAKEWLLFAVTKAEMEMGGGTGALKLHYVYDMFVKRFPALAKIVKYERFEEWVKMALVRMDIMLQDSEKTRELVGKD